MGDQGIVQHDTKREQPQTNKKKTWKENNHKKEGEQEVNILEGNQTNDGSKELE